MGHTLGIDIGAEVTTAALVGDDGSVVVMPLGDGRAATASVILRRDDGATLVGDAAVREATDRGDLIRDPMSALAAGTQPVGLRALIAHVMGRAAAALGGSPELVALVHSDDWDVARQDRLVGVARAAGAPAVVLVSDRVAVQHRIEEPEPSAALAVGAAVVAATTGGPIVTREDMGDSPAPRGPVARPPAAVGSVSVFDERGSEGSVPSEPAPPSATSPDPAVAPTTAVPVARPPLRPPVDTRGGPRQSVVLAVGSVAIIIVAIVIVLLVLASGGSDEAGDEVTDGDVFPSVTAPATTTSTGPSTTEPATTAPSTTASTTTSSSTSTTSSSTSTTSTTTVPVAVGTPGPVTLVETGLRLDTGPVVRFGDDGDSVLAEIAGVLGDPDSDSGFAEVAFCFSPRSRFVRWGQLEVVIGEDDEGATTFTQWFVDGVDEPTGLVTIDGLGVGATVAFLDGNYGSALDLAPAFEGADEGIFAATNSGSGASLFGLTTSLEPDGRIVQLWGSNECTRVFT